MFHSWNTWSLSFASYSDLADHVYTLVSLLMSLIGPSVWPSSLTLCSSEFDPKANEDKMTIVKIHNLFCLVWRPWPKSLNAGSAKVSVGKNLYLLQASCLPNVHRGKRKDLFTIGQMNACLSTKNLWFKLFMRFAHDKHLYVLSNHAWLICVTAINIQLVVYGGLNFWEAQFMHAIAARRLYFAHNEYKFLPCGFVYWWRRAQGIYQH